MKQHKYPKLLKDLALYLLLAQIEIGKRKAVIPATDKQVEPALKDSDSEDGDDAKETTICRNLEEVD